MCQFIVTNERQHITTARQLAQWIGIEPEQLVPIDEEPWPDDLKSDWRDACLCPFDLEFNLDKFGIWHRRNLDGDSMMILAMKDHPK